MATSRRNVYIEQGRVVDRPSFVFDWTRFLVIIFLGAVFFLTNPGNDTFHSVLPKPFSKLLLRETTVLPSPSPSWRWTTTLSYSGIAAVSTNTNYGIFSLQKRSSAISISGMLHVVPLCRLDDNYSPAFYVCDILGACEDDLFWETSNCLPPPVMKANIIIVCLLHAQIS
jgi:hypothetical protein